MSFGRTFFLSDPIWRTGVVPGSLRRARPLGDSATAWPSWGDHFRDGSPIVESREKEPPRGTHRLWMAGCPDEARELATRLRCSAQLIGRPTANRVEGHWAPKPGLDARPGCEARRAALARRERRRAPGYARTSMLMEQGATASRGRLFAIASFNPPSLPAQETKYPSQRTSLRRAVSTKSAKHSGSPNPHRKPPRPKSRRARARMPRKRSCARFAPSRSKWRGPRAASCRRARRGRSRGRWRRRVGGPWRLHVAPGIRLRVRPRKRGFDRFVSHARPKGQ